MKRTAPPSCRLIRLLRDLTTNDQSSGRFLVLSPTPAYNKNWMQHPDKTSFRLPERTAMGLLAIVVCLSHAVLAQETEEFTPAESPAPAESTAPAKSSAPAKVTAPTAESVTPAPAESRPEPQTQKRTTRGQKQVMVEWYQPDLGLSDKTNFTAVTLSGRTRPRTKVRIANDQVVIITRKGDIKSMKAERVFKNREATADARGIFDMNLELPTMTAQIPIEVQYPSGELRKYQINLDVQKEDVKMTNANTKGSPYARRKWGLWGGFGFNFLKYDQTSSIPSEVGFQSFAGPSIYAKVARSLSREWAMQMTYNQSPGKTQSSDEIKVTEGSYNWTFYTSEFTYFKNNWKKRYRNYLTQFGAQGGVQYHVVPFIVRSSTTDASVASVDTNTVLMGTAGGTWLIHYDRYWLFETFARYQHPLSSGSTFKIEPIYAVDGSVGVIYKWKPDVRAGFFWYGQMHAYNYSGHTDKYNAANGGTPTVNGKQTLFFTNLEFRVGWEFD